MNETSILSKTGKGVHEASGKSSFLSRSDRAVLAQVDGKSTVAELNKKFEKIDPAKFQLLMQQLEKDGFVREITPASAPAAPRPSAAKPSAPKPAAPPPSGDLGEDLDFTAVAPAKKPAAPKAPPIDLAAQARAASAEAASEKATDFKAREEAQAKAAALAAQRARAEAEARAKAAAAAQAKAVAEAEAKAKADAEAAARAKAQAEAKLKAEADARAKAEAELKARAEAKAREEAETKARIEAEAKAKVAAERAQKEAEEKARREAEENARMEAELKAEAEKERLRAEAERIARDEAMRKEAEEKARREEEERLRLEAERKAKEEAERKAREEAERLRREAEEKARKEAEEKARREEEERQRIEAERKAKEEAERKAKEEAERNAKEEAERLAREAEEKARKEAEEKARVEAERKAREESERLAREAEEKARKEAEEKARKDAEVAAAAAAAVASAPPPAAPETPAQPEKPAASMNDALLADLDSFSLREDEERERKEAEEKARKEAEDKARREAEAKAKREADEKKALEEAEAKRKRDAEAQAAREAEERAAREEEERKQRAKESRERLLAGIQPAKSAAPAKSADEFDDIDLTDADLDMDDVKADAKKLATGKAGADPERDKRVRADIDSAARKAARTAEPPPSIPNIQEPVRPRRPVRWGKPAAIALLVLLVGGLGALHVMPVSTAPYEKAASEALGRPVKIGSARMSLITGAQVKFEGVTIGEGVRIAAVQGSLPAGSLFGDRKTFSQMTLEGLSAPQSELGALLFGSLKGGDFVAGRISAAKAKLTGPLALPDLDIDVTIAPGGAVQSVALKSAENKLAARILPQGESASVEINAGSMQLPFAPAISLSDFALKGTLNAKELVASAWDGKLYDGIFSGTARIRWSPEWSVEGDVQVKQFNANVLAPAILSEGRADARGAFSMSGPAPEKLGSAARLEGTFIVSKGVLGSFSLSRALQPTSAQAGGRTEFSELTGVGVYNKGAVQVRNLRLSAGLLTANGAADVDASGALSGRVNAELGQQRGAFSLSGTTKEPVLKK